MHLRHGFVWLLLSLTGTAMAQQTPHLAKSAQRKQFDGLSHVEVELGRKNALILGFQTFRQIEARQNIDSVLRLFAADYKRIADTTQSPAQPVRILYRLSPDSRRIDVRNPPVSITTFRFASGLDSPTLLKTQQDTLQIVWSSETLPRYPVTAYLLVNNVSDINEIVQSGGLNGKIRQAFEAIRTYKGHDLTDPKMAFNLVQDVTGKAQFIDPGLARSPFISIHLLGIGVGLIRSQWAASINPSLEFVPNRMKSTGYSVGYLSTFFGSTTDGRMLTQRNDFLTLGVSFYKRDAIRGEPDLAKLRVGLSAGLLVHRSGSYFNENTIRLSGELPLSNLIRLQPELYMNGFFRQVFPGLRVAVGF